MNQSKKIKTELYNDNFQNYKRYGIPKAQFHFINHYINT